MLVIPSLINSNRVLNLSENKSFIKNLNKEGFNVFMINWLPKRSVKEKQFGFLNYVDEIILPHAEFILEKTGQKPIILGHCMGALLATFSAIKSPEKFDGLVTISMPWNFEHEAFVKVSHELMSNFLSDEEFVSKEFISSLFAVANFRKIYDKYIAFESILNDESAQIERWLNNGLDMSKQLFLECVEKLINRNSLIQGDFELTTNKLLLKTIGFIGNEDKVVPKKCSEPFFEMNKNAYLKEYKAGHLGVILRHGADISKEILRYFTVNP